MRRREISDLWLGRYVDPVVLSETSAFRILGVFDPRLERRLTVVAAAEQRLAEGPARADVAGLGAALDRLYRAHHAPPHPVIAPAIERAEHEGVPFVVFDFPARLDFDRLLQIGLDAGWKADYDHADGYSTTLRDALLANEARVDPETGAPPRLHVFGHGNVLFAGDGRHVLLGLGHNVVVHDERGRLVVRSRFFQAPEIAVGGAPSLSSDLVGMIEMTRATMAFVNVKESIGRIIVGNSVGQDVELVRLVLWFESRVMRGQPSTRPPVHEIIAASNRIRALIGCVPDPEGFRAYVARMLASERPDLVAGGPALQVARDGSWFALGDTRADLKKNRLLGRLLRALTDARLGSPGRGMPVDDLMAAGWPGEKMQHEAGLNRVYVAVAALRRAGLGTELERDYRLRPSLRVELVEP